MAAESDARQRAAGDGAALAGLHVLEIGHGIAVGTAAMFLADFGAEVVKIEPPEGARDRGNPGFAVRGRGKKSVVIDHTQPHHIRWVARMVAGADVCIIDDSSHPVWTDPAVQEAVCANGRLITLAMPVYVDGSTPWVGGRESNRLLSATLGQATRQSSWDGGPIDSVSPFPLYIHGLWAAVCAGATLLERATSGHGQTVTVTGVNAVMEATMMALSVDPSLPDAPTDVGPSGRHPTYRQLQCANGQWMSSGALGGKFERTLLEILGLSAILDDPRLQGTPTRMVLPENMGWCIELIDARAATWDRDDLVSEMLARGVPAGPMRDRTAYLDDDQVRSIGMRIEANSPDLGSVTMPGHPIVLTRTPAVVGAGSPKLGQDKGIEPWAAYPKVEGAAPLRNGPLSGVRVLNLGTFVATPYAGLLLAELGAEVVKVEPLTGDPFRASAYSVNRGMKSIAVDLKNPDGIRVIHQLVAQSDIVLDGMRPGVMRDLGLDYDTLARVNPGVITMSLSAYGEGGPLSDAPGVDMVVQAFTGMMTAQGGDDVPVAHTIPINDVTAAAVSTLACVLALLERSRSGAGQRVWDSLLGTAGFLQMDDLVRYAGRPPIALGGRDFQGPSIVNRYYRAADGWIALDVTDDADVGERLIAASLPAGDDPDLLAKEFAALPARLLVDRLNAAGLPATRARGVNEVLRDPKLMANEFIHIRPSDSGGVFVVPGRMSTFGRTQRFGQLFPPGVGEHTRAILVGLGLADDAIDAMIRDKVVAQGGPMAAELMAPYR